ncbi:hypothetical protein ACHAWF_002432 [Thalassiosira exigua]
MPNHNVKVRSEVGSSRLDKKERERSIRGNNKQRLSEKTTKKNDGSKTKKGQTRLRRNERQWKRESTPARFISQTIADDDCYFYYDSDAEAYSWDQYTGYEWEEGPSRFFLRHQIYRQVNENGDEEESFAHDVHWLSNNRNDDTVESEDVISKTLSRLRKDAILAGLWSGECALRRTIVGLSKLCALGRATPKDEKGLLADLASLPGMMQRYILTMTYNSCSRVDLFNPGIYVCQNSEYQSMVMMLILYPGLQAARMLSYSEWSDELSTEDMITLALDPNLPLWKIRWHGRTFRVVTSMGIFSGKAVWQNARSSTAGPNAEDHVQRSSATRGETQDSGLQENRHSIGFSTYADSLRGRGILTHKKFARQPSPIKEKGSWAILSIGKDNVKDKRLFKKFGYEEENLWGLVVPL